MTPGDVITEVRRLISDTRQPTRYDDDTLLGFVNQTLKRMVVLRPDLFSEIDEIPTVPGVVLQSLPADAVRLVEIFQIKGGSAVTEVSREMLDESTPTWVSDLPGVPVNYMRHVRNPYKFFLYPRPIEGVILIGEYVKSPPVYTINQTIQQFPEAYFSTLVDGTVFLAESIDDEHVNSGRAELYQNSFIQTLGVGLQLRNITDTENSTIDQNQEP